MTLRRCLALSLVLSACAALVSAAPAVREETPAFFKAHRERLLERLPVDGVAVFRTTAEKDIDAATDPFRPDSDFFYLTGFPEVDAVAVFRPNAPDGKRYILFVEPKDFTKEQWTGYRAGTEGAVKEYGADEAFPVADLWTKLPSLFVGAKSLQFSVPGEEAKFREQLLAAWNQENRNAVGPRPTAEAGPVVHQLRLVKDDTEVAILRRAAVLSAEAHRAAMARVRPGVNEAVLKGLMVSHCVSNGAARMAYPPIVGSGRNSVILHYLTDDQVMEAGSMVVNDTACEYGMYAADVTRSYPASGRFSSDQRAIYEIVLAAQKAGIALVKPGTVFRDVHAATVDVVVDGLMKLGILTGSREEIMKERTYRKFYPHGSSHWLGLDVHDAGSYGYPEGMDPKDRYGKAMVKLEPGMVLTVEPGIYIAEGSTPDKRWWNIGARIEDDVLVTAAGSDCLSCGAPREIADIEKGIAAR